jgi:DNA recombination protein RmuC
MELHALLALAIAILAVQIVILLRGKGGSDAVATHAAHAALAERIERVEREVRMQLQATAQAQRQEMGHTLAQSHAATMQGLDAMRRQIEGLTESNARRMAEVRVTLETRIRDLQADNGARLEEMRQTVDEKLHATLESRLTESFKQVSERLERVHQGLGEMQQLALGVGDLKRVLTNVKTRGTWGEVQLEMLLEQVLTPEQYGKNVETVAGSNARVEFALKLPGHRCGCRSTPSSRRSSTNA